MDEDLGVEELVLLALRYEEDPSSMEHSEKGYASLDDLRRDEFIKLVQLSLTALEAYRQLPWRKRLFRRPPSSATKYIKDFLGIYRKIGSDSFREMNAELSSQLEAIDQIGTQAFDPRYQSAVCAYRSAVVRQLNLLEPALASMAELDELRDRSLNALDR